MNLKIGIIGLPNVGKSTLFNALLKKQVAEAANYPFCTIEPNIGVVEVPDRRLKELFDIVVKTEHLSDRLPKIIPAAVEFVDIAGLVKGAAEGEGLGNKFLSHIRDCQMILEVVRDFTDENVVRAGAVNPEEDVKTIKTELILKDLETLQGVLSRTKSVGARSSRPQNGSDGPAPTGLGGPTHRSAPTTKMITALNQDFLASEISLSDAEILAVKDLQLLTMKPIVYVRNVDEASVGASRGSPGPSRVGHDRPLQIEQQRENEISISAKLESELSALSSEDQQAYLSQLGLKESGLDRVIRLCYHTLGLQTFFTAGPKEVRAWTIKQGDKAPAAAGVIHTDFEKGFIAAEVCHYADFVKLDGLKNAKERGFVRTEGKDYVMQEGDIVEFRFNT